MQDIKGFEFRLVLIVGCEAGMLPSPGIHAEEAWREALRLYVAMTRARDQVFFLFENEPSEFLMTMENDLIFRTQNVAVQYEIEPPAMPIAAPLLLVEDSPQETLLTSKKVLQLDEDCESQFTKPELEILRKYFAHHVYEFSNAPSTFREWNKLGNLRQINFAQLAMIGRKDKAAFESLRRKFIQLDI